MRTINHTQDKQYVYERSSIMKKIFLLSILVLLVGVSGTAFAAPVGYTTDTLTLGTAGDLQLVVKTSKNVNMRIDVSTAAAPLPTVNYIMTAYHGTGSRTFGTSNMDQKLYYQETTGVNGPAVTTSTTVAPVWTGWTAL
jgi:hypothetical protein